MSQNGNGSQGTGRQRRVERYAGEFLGEPSMSAAQPIPGKPGHAAAEPRKNANIPAPPPMEEAPAAPVQDGRQQPWSMPMDTYPQQWAAPVEYPPQQQSYQQPVYPEQTWSQPQQPMPQQTWTQPGQPQQGWSQPVSGVPSWQGANGYTPPPIYSEQPAEGMPPVKKIGWPWWKLAILAAVAVLLIVGMTMGGTQLAEQNALVQEVSAYNSRFCEGVYVDGIHLGGMTQDEAFRAVSASAQERMDAWYIRLEYQGGLVRRITAKDLGMTVNVSDALEEAWQLGHASSDAAERKAAMDALLETPYYGYTASPSGDTTVVDTILNQLASVVYSLPQDAYVSDFDPEAHSNPFTIVPEVYGSMLDVAPVRGQIYAMVDAMQSGAVELTVVPLKPSVTEADLRQARTLRGSATTDISTTSTEGRTENIRRAFEIINGTMLKPGESFSFNGIVGPRSAKNGFHKAIEYAYGVERDGYGGGVCQASTTVYLAAVRANMTITHREPHSDKVNYTEYGLDATVNLDGKVIDLTFKNTTGSDVYILTYLTRSGGRRVCHVDIYGMAHPEGVTYDLVAETVQVLPAPVDPEYVEDKDGEHVIYIDDKPVQKRKASDGCVVETFIVKYVNGKEAERTYVARDTYKAKAQQFWVGVSERDDLWVP